MLLYIKKVYLCIMIEFPDIKELFTSISEIYETEVLTTSELITILVNSGYSEPQARIIVRYAANNKQIGIVTYRKLRNTPPRNALLVLHPKKKK